MKTIDTPAILQVVGPIKGSILRVAVNVGRPLRLMSCSRTRFAIVALVTALLLLASSVDLDYMHSRGSRVTAFAESISTFASNCSTPATTFNLGDTVCATVSGAPLPGPPIFGGFRQRRFQWVAPNGVVVRYADILTDPQNDSFTIPIDGSSAQVGIWSVRTIDNSGSVFALARFAVSNPQAAAVDLSLVASVGAAQSQVTAGTNLSFKIFLTNFGPDDAQSVAITSSVPANTTFVADTQDSGLDFTCTTPSPGSGTGDISCTIATLPVNATAVFTFTFNVNGGTADGTIITGVASASSSTSELQPADNTGSSSATVSSGATGCTLNCSSNIDADNDANQCSAIVTYASPTVSGDCGTPPDNAVICSPPSGSAFPIGVTSVNCTTQTGGACSFSVTVHDTRTPVQPTITCPSSITVSEEFPDSSSATVNYPAPTTTGNCVTTVCDPPSGSSFNVGTTTVDCTATDSANNSLSCSFTVTVTSGAACTLTCPGDVTQSAASGQCTAVVTYSDPATSGNCGTVTCTPPSGSTFVAGSTAVTCTSSEGPSCSFTVTVVASGTPTITTCASNKTVSTNAACEATIPNLVSEVVATGCNVTVSQAPAAGSIVGPGTITVTITAENSAGEATCTATVNVVDATAPTITTCPAPTSTTVGSSCQAAVPDVTTGVTAADNCTAAGALTISQSPAVGTMVGVGTNTITITVKDASNNSTTCTTTFTVNDVTPPSISCPADVSATAALGQLSTAVTFSPTVTDNCSGATAVCVPPSGSVFQLGVTTVSCTATDASGNQAGCTFKVAVSGTLLATADSFLRNGADNTNEGGNDLLRIQSSGHNRVLARFNVSGIPTSGLQSATLVLKITENSDNWGSTGRLVDAHRLLADWTEGNGHTVGDQPNFRGTGEGVTWNCAKDSDIANQNDDCTSPWNGGIIAAATAASVLHTNNQTGDVSWNVTADVQAGANYGWVVRKQVEGQNGQVRYFSREGAAGNPSLGPRLVLAYQP